MVYYDNGLSIIIGQGFRSHSRFRGLVRLYLETSLWSLAWMRANASARFLSPCDYLAILHYDVHTRIISLIVYGRTYTTHTRAHHGNCIGCVGSMLPCPRCRATRRLVFCYFADNSNGGMNVRDWLRSAIRVVSRDLERSITPAPRRLPCFVYAV